ALDSANYEAIEQFMAFKEKGFFIAFFVMFLFLFQLKERNAGNYLLINSTASGRGKNHIKNVLATSAVMTIFVVTYFIVMILGAMCRYGFDGSLLAPVQSLMICNRFTLRINILSFIIIYILYYIVVMSNLMLLLYFLTQIFSNPAFSVLSAIIITVIGMALATIKDYGSFGIIKYFEIYNYILNDESIYIYNNLNFGERPVNSFFILLMVNLATALILITSIYFAGEKIRKVTRTSRWSIGISHRHFRIFEFENYKLLIQKKGILVLIIGFIILFKTLDLNNVLMVGNTKQLIDIYENYSDKSLEEIKGFVKSEKKKNKNFENIYKIKTILYYKGKISKGEYVNLVKVNEAKMLYKKTIESIDDQLLYIDQMRQEKKIDVKLINEKPYNIFFGTGYLNIRKAMLMSLINIIMILLISYPLYSFDRENDMRQVIRTTKKGRENLFFQRSGNILLLAFLITISSVIFRIIEINNNYKFEKIGAPVQSIRLFKEFKPHISIIGFFIIFVLIQSLLLASFGLICSVLSDKMGGVKGLIIAVLIFVLPDSLTYLGINFMGNVTFAQALIFNNIMSDYGPGLALFAAGMMAALFILVYYFLEGREEV
ncbi:MAG: hypothetical protein IIY49_09785, partial [Eubacterium sp.]|nr:hypothetical protein [Eubacterium sp.]